MSLLRVTVIVVSLVVLAVPSLRAERFSTITDAQKLMFPEASFESHPVRYSADQIRAIEKRSGVKVLRSGNRVAVAHDSTNILGVVIHDQVWGKHELIDYAVAIDADGRVKSVEILEYRESYGGEIKGSKWRAQFQGKSANDPVRLHRDVHNLSGATISCRNVTEGVKRLLATYELVLRPRFVDPGVVPQSVAAAKHRR